MFIDAWVQSGQRSDWILKGVQTLGLDGVTLFASAPSPSGGLPRPLYAPNAPQFLRQHAKALSVPLRLGWCEWLDTRPAALSAMFQRWSLVDWTHIDLLELDAEEAVRARELDYAMERIEAEIRQRRGVGFRGEVAITLVPTARHQVRLLELAQVLRPQWYVFRRPDAGGPHWSHGLARPSEQIPRWAKQALDLQAPHQRLEAGLAGYWQEGVKGSGGKPDVAAAESARAAAAYTDHACYWSLNWLLKNRSPRVLDASDVVASLTSAEDEEQPLGARELVRRVQWALVALGEDLGRFGLCNDGVDGRWGKRSAVAATRWEARLGLPADGHPDEGLLEGLEAALEERGKGMTFEGSALEARGS